MPFLTNQMNQIPIKFFYPLTEQIELDLDYTPCHNHEYQKRKEKLANSVLSYDGSITMSTVCRVDPVFQINVDDNQIVVVSKEKPNLIKRIIYNAFGMKWRQS